MSTMGTFDAFTSARLGIYAAQHGFRVTGNNISNINTVGYTRQRLDQVSFKAGAYDRYRSQLDNHVGSGALVMNINQVRDPTLDVRFRDVNASVGYSNEMLEGLERIASILDEVGVGDDTNVNKKGDGRLHAQIQAVLDALRQFSKDPTKTNDNLVRNAASSLCEIINSYARELETLRVETEQKFTDQITEINECLTNIRNLNEEIRDNEIFGDNALELRDERNRQIDKLSEYLHISVTYSYEDVGAGKQVEKLTIRLDDSNPDTDVHSDEALLIDGIFGAQINSPKTLPVANPYYDPEKALKDDGTGAMVPDAECQPFAFRYSTGKPLTQDGHSVYIDKNGTLYLSDDGKTNVDGGADLPDGVMQVMEGTNDPEKAEQFDNDYYHLQISKLLDQRNREWEGVHTKWAEAADGQIAQKAIYDIKLSASSGWADTQEFNVAGTTYTIGTDITADDANDPKKFAQFIAAKLNEVNQDYSVSARGDGTIRFIAKNAGAIGGAGPAAAPTLTFTPGNPGGTVTLDPAAEVQQGQDEERPTGYPGGSTQNPDGSETIISFAISDGKWMQATTYKEHTYELTLDDNDTYGSLQAVRELLTEAGEFTTTTVRDTIDENGAKKRGIPYYQNALDLFARKFAETYNGLNQGVAVDQNGDLLPETKEVSIPAMIKVYNPDTKLYEVWEFDKTAAANPDDPIGGLPNGDQTDFQTLTFDPTGPNPITRDQLTTAGYKQKVNADSAPWSVDGKNYCVSNIGGKMYYTGLHEEQGVCIITGKIPIAEYDNNGKITNVDAVLTGLEQTGFDYATCIQIRNESDPDKRAQMTEDLLKSCLAAHGVNTGESPTETVIVNKDVKMGGPLFSNRNDGDDTTNITAANITISHSWSSGDVQLIPKFEVLWDGEVENSSQNTNADHMVSVLDKDAILTFDPRDIVPDAVSDKFFQGSFGGMFNDICTTLGEDTKKVTVSLNMYYTQSIEIDTARDGVSGVDLNDEAMNLMQFQKAYSAACRLMTVVDESLDRLINNTGVAGR